MRISDPNKLAGKIMKVKAGQDMTEVIVDIGDRPLIVTITRSAADDMALKAGDEVFAMFNSTSITLIKD